MRLSNLLVCIGLVAFATVSQGAETDESSLDPAQPCTAERLNPVDYDCEMKFIVTAPAMTKLLRVWIPIPITDESQELRDTVWSTFPSEIAPAIGKEPKFGNTFAYFEFSNPQGAQIMRHRFSMRAHELRWNLDPEKIVSVKRWPKSFDAYRQSESQAVVYDSRFEKLLGEIVPARKNPLLDMRNVMTWVDDNFVYDHERASLRGSSEHGLEVRAGHCSDYHGFCAAMGRLLGQPTRVTYGINAFPKASPSHCKLEAYLPPYGWVPFDVSETQKLVASIRTDEKFSLEERDALIAAARKRTFSGFRDNTWFRQTVGTDYDLAPLASQRAPVVRTLYAEADGKPLADPDPSDPHETSFAWMTAHRFRAKPEVKYAFTDAASLRDWLTPARAKSAE